MARYGATATADTIVYVQGDNVDSIGVNTPVMILGSLQAYKNFITGKVLVYVLAETAQQITGEHWDYENEVQLSGALGSGITYRETPLGKRISDISVKQRRTTRTSRNFLEYTKAANR